MNILYTFASCKSSIFLSGSLQTFHDLLVHEFLWKECDIFFLIISLNAHARALAYTHKHKNTNTKMHTHALAHTRACTRTLTCARMYACRLGMSIDWKNQTHISSPFARLHKNTLMKIFTCVRFSFSP